MSIESMAQNYWPQTPMSGLLRNTTLKKAPGDPAWHEALHATEERGDIGRLGARIELLHRCAWGWWSSNDGKIQGIWWSSMGSGVMKIWSSLIIFGDGKVVESEDISWWYHVDTMWIQWGHTYSYISLYTIRNIYIHTIICLIYIYMINESEVKSEEANNGKLI